MKFTVTVYDAKGGTNTWKNVSRVEFIDPIEPNRAQSFASYGKVLSVVPRNVIAVVTAEEPEEPKS